MKKALTYLFCLLTVQTFAQQTKEHFNKTIQIAKGDLNKDGIDDEVVVTQDTLNPEKPYRLQIFFYQKDGSKKLMIATDKAIEAETEASSYGKSFDKDGIQITAGVLRIYEQLLRGNYTHIFRYQNGNFELIGYNEVGSDGLGKSYETDFNLSTSIKVEKVVNYENDKVLSNKQTKVLIRPLPKLQDFAPYEDDRY